MPLVSFRICRCCWMISSQPLDRIRVSMGGSSGEGAGRVGQIISIAGVGGGVGSTALVVNAAASLA